MSTINRDAAIAYSISGMTREIDGDKWIRVSEVRESIKTMPSAQPERKKGQWIYNESDDMFECSVCGGEMIRNVFTYCPWCGERMVRGDEMTSKEAAEYILDHFIGDDTKWDKAMFLAYCALQKQIPKKPLQACGHAIEMFRESIPSMNYCPICGQRIDWKGEEDERTD